jgi:hypothetical protein
MAPKPKPKPKTKLGAAPRTAPDDVSMTGTRRSGPASVDGRTPDPGKEQDARLETYEQEVERASVQSLAEHPEGSASPLERLVDAEADKGRK